MLLLAVSWTTALDNGLALTPPMGWLSWERFRCNTDCENDPDNCIGEKLFMQMADRLVQDGYRDAGYELINVDDCYLAKERDSSGRLQPDPRRFPRGIKFLADYVHSRGLKFGIYEDYGNFTCAGYPGVLGHMDVDAQTFADWEVDYLKLDGCYADPRDMDKGYPEMGFYLNKTGRPMVYSCSWPVYQIVSGIPPNYSAIGQTCNLWRNYNDIDDSWDSVQTIIDYYGDNQDILIPLAGPGRWNDPDMLIIGNFGLSYEQCRAQMAIWAILAAPLLMSVDLRTIKPDYRNILINKQLIAVNQDPLGIQGRRVYKNKGIEIWARPITPFGGEFFSYAIAFLNRRTDGTPSEVSVGLRELGLVYSAGYQVTELFEKKDFGVLFPKDALRVSVNPTGVVIVRADILPPPRAQFGRPFFRPAFNAEQDIFHAPAQKPEFRLPFAQGTFAPDFRHEENAFQKKR